MKMKLLAAVVAASTLAATSANAEVKVSTKGGLKVESGDYKFEFGGRIQYDYNDAEVNGITDEEGFDIRRARVFARGNISKNWKFKTQFNVDGGGVEDLYLRYTGWGKAANVTIGNQKQPFGLEELTSSKDISSLERSSVTELFAVGREEGVQLHGKLSGNQTYAIGGFFADTIAEGANGADAGDEFGFAARYTIAPVKTDTSVVHLGIGYRVSDFENLDAGDFGVDDAFALELAATSGPFHIQAEYFDGDVVLGTDTFGDVEVSADAFYIQAGYILTGETRPYSGGKFKRVKPGSKSGAWEIVVRYEDGYGEFDDIELAQGDSIVVPGSSEVLDTNGFTEGDAITFGVNYYAHKNVRIGASYTDGSNDLIDEDGEEFRVRFQLTF